MQYIFSNFILLILNRGAGPHTTTRAQMLRHVRGFGTLHSARLDCGVPMLPFYMDHYTCLDSTNTHALRCIRGAQNSPEDMQLLRYRVIQADAQTRGYGQYGKIWQSPPGNLYVSVLLPLNLIPETEHYGRYAIGAGVAVAKTLQKACPHTGVRIKWPNDVWIEQAKISGILVEIEPPFAVIGVGVNCTRAPVLPLKVPTTCTKDHGAQFVDNALLCHWFLEKLSDVCTVWTEEGFSKICKLWEALCWEVGQDLSLRHGVSGRFLRLGAHGEMLVRRADGSIVTLSSPTAL